MLEVRNVTVTFGELVALDEVWLEVGPDEIVALLGPSGSGKSTLLRVIAGLQRPDRGEVWWEGAVLGTRAPHTRGFGLMFQDYALFPHLDVAANVGFGLRMTGIPEAVRVARTAEMLRLVGLEGFEHRSVDTLSGGEQQRVALARALAPNPRLLMLDEPVGALDRALRARLIGEVGHILREMSIPAIYVTHDQEEAFALADRVAVLAAGRIVQVGTPAELWNRPASRFVADFLGHDVIVEVRAARGVIATPWGAVTGDLADGTHTVAVPPSAVHLDPAGEISAEVVATSFSTGRSRVELRALNVPLVADHAGPAPEVGESVHITIDTASLVPVPT
jgi:thiamine transport system ATP-binding protein